MSKSEKPKYRTFIIYGKTEQWKLWLILGVLLALVVVFTGYIARYLALNDPRLKEDIIDKDGVILQNTGYSCGPASITMMLRDKGFHVTQLEVAKVAYTGIFGTRTSSMPQIADKYGLSLDIRNLNFDEIIDINLPMILEEEKHVVYLAPDLASRLIHVKDPMTGLLIMDKNTFYEYFSPREKKKCYIFQKL